MSRATSLGDSNSRMLMALVDGFLSHYPGRTENQHGQNSKPYHGHAPWFTSPFVPLADSCTAQTTCTRCNDLFDHLVGE